MKVETFGQNIKTDFLKIIWKIMPKLGLYFFNGYSIWLKGSFMYSQYHKFKL